MITIVDFGISNTGSIVNMLKKCGVPAAVTTSGEEVARAEKLVLPGVGSYDHAMRRLAESGLVRILDERVRNHGVPMLGICLGMQLLTKRSEEGELPGLGWLDAETVRFRFAGGSGKYKVPHMGWNMVGRRPGADGLWSVGPESRFYFVHSYYVVCHDSKDVLATSSYGCDFTAAVRRSNIFGVQFHPEKSHRFGMAVLREFAEL